VEQNEDEEVNFDPQYYAQKEAMIIEENSPLQ